MQRYFLRIVVALGLFITVPLIATTALAAPPSQSDRCRTYIETGSFAVCDDAAARFLTAFDTYGLQRIGYPISHRFVRDGFTTQVFQKAILQWRADTGTVAFVNILDELHNVGWDEDLFLMWQTPRQLPDGWDGAGLSFAQITANRQALLNQRPALRAAYFSVGDPMLFYGLPTSEVEDMGNHYAIRLQRAVLQEWKVNVPWARAGEVTVANGGDMARAMEWLDTTPPVPTTLTPIALRELSHPLAAGTVPNGRVVWEVQNARPQSLQIEITGSTTITAEVGGYTDCVAYQPKGCPNRGPIVEIELPAGSYQVRMTVAGEEVPYQGFFTFMDGTQYSSCYYRNAEPYDPTTDPVVVVETALPPIIGSAPLHELMPGSCFTYPPNYEEATDEVNLHDCDQPHLYEVYAVIALDNVADAPHPGHDFFFRFGYDSCLEAFEPYVGISYYRSLLYFQSVSPTERLWEEGNRTVRCLLYQPLKPNITGSPHLYLRGTMKDARR